MKGFNKAMKAVGLAAMDANENRDPGSRRRAKSVRAAKRAINKATRRAHKCLTKLESE